MDGPGKGFRYLEMWDDHPMDPGISLDKCQHTHRIEVWRIFLQLIFMADV